MQNHAHWYFTSHKTMVAKPSSYLLLLVIAADARGLSYITKVCTRACKYDAKIDVHFCTNAPRQCRRATGRSSRAFWRSPPGWPWSAPPPPRISSAGWAPWPAPIWPRPSSKSAPAPTLRRPHSWRHRRLHARRAHVGVRRVEIVLGGLEKSGYELWQLVEQGEQWLAAAIANVQGFPLFC